MRAWCSRRASDGGSEVAELSHDRVTNEVPVPVDGEAVPVAPLAEYVTRSDVVPPCAGDDISNSGRGRVELVQVVNICGRVKFLYPETQVAAVGGVEYVEEV